MLQRVRISRPARKQACRRAPATSGTDDEDSQWRPSLDFGRSYAVQAYLSRGSPTLSSLAAGVFAAPNQTRRMSRDIRRVSTGYLPAAAAAAAVTTTATAAVAAAATTAARTTTAATAAGL